MPHVTMMAIQEWGLYNIPCDHNGYAGLEIKGRELYIKEFEKRIGNRKMW